MGGRYLFSIEYSLLQSIIVQLNQLHSLILSACLQSAFCPLTIWMFIIFEENS